MGWERLAARPLVTWCERLRGLLGTDATTEPVVLVRCSSIHTFGMHYALDVALVSKNGQVLVSRRQVPPGRVVSHKDAFYALERPAEQGPWPPKGTTLRTEIVRRDNNREV